MEKKNDEGELRVMDTRFAETLKRLRKERGLSQLQLGSKMFVNGSTVARWENGSRLPDAAMITRLARVLAVDVAALLSSAAESDESPNMIMVDDNMAVLADSLLVLEEVVPEATVAGFSRPREAVEYAKANRIDVAILDIELGTASGFDLCQTLRSINPCTSVIFLTAYPDYALSAWNTDASGFLVKPLTPEDVRRQLEKLHYPFPKGGKD